MRWLCIGAVLAFVSPNMVQSQEQSDTTYFIRFLKKVETIYVLEGGRQQIIHIGAKTNAKTTRRVLFRSNIYVRASAGWGHIDTVSTVNRTSYPDKDGYVGNVFGAFPSMAGMTAIIIAEVVDDVTTSMEFRYPEQRKILAADTMRVRIRRTIKSRNLESE